MNWMDIRRKHALPDADSALPGRAEAMPVIDRHAVLAHFATALCGAPRAGVVGMGCFWGWSVCFGRFPGS